MRCFYHPEAEAVGVCRACGRGLCAESAAETAGGLACRGRHEEEVERVSRAVNRNVAITGKVGLPQIGLMIVAGFGAVALAWLAYGYVGTGEAQWAVIYGIMSVFFALFSLSFVRALLIKPKKID